MAEYTRGQRRSEFIARARIAVRRGVSQAAFLRQAIAGGYSLRRQVMLDEWRGMKGLEQKKDLLQFVRKDRLPSARVIAEMPWDITYEYMYVMKVYSRTRPGEDVISRNINIMHDRLLTPGEVEGLAWELIQEQSPKLQAQVVSIVPWAVVHRDL